MISVVKRNGSIEKYNFDKIKFYIDAALENIDNIDKDKWINDIKETYSIRQNNELVLNSKNIQLELVKSALSEISITEPNWTYVASKLLLFDLYNNIRIHYGKKHKKYSISIYEDITLKDYISKNKLIFSNWYKKYSKSDIEFLNKHIKQERDYLYNFNGMNMLFNTYLSKNQEGKIVELPQHMHMSIAMYLMQNETNKLDRILELYNSTSTLEVILATPINANGRLKHGSTISCILSQVEDTTNSITDVVKEAADASRNGSGLGLDFSLLRSKGSPCMGNPNASNGKIPFLKLINDVAVAWNQAGKRPGSICCYIQWFDIDVLDFLELRKSSGDERVRCRDLFTGISYNDIFFMREKEDKEITLFSPYDIKDLLDLYGKDFTLAYEKHEKRFKEYPELYNKNTKTIKARDLLRKIIISYTETGMPFAMFKDNANENHKLKKYNLKTISSSNLCTEILQPIDNRYTGVCNLASINFSKYSDSKRLKEVLYITNRALDNAIDLTKYPSKKAERFQKDFRSIGIGMLGIAEYLANNKIHYGSKEHEKLCDKTWKFIKKTLEESSKELAKEKGKIKIDYKGCRNAYLMAIAPNSGTAILAGTTNGVEPAFNLVWADETKLGTTITTAPNLNRNNIEYYKNPYEVPMKDQLKINSIRQKYIDMGISQNIYIDPENISMKEIRDMIVYAWEVGLKTLYYCRSMPPKKTEIPNSLKIKCVGCEN